MLQIQEILEEFPAWNTDIGLVLTKEKDGKEHVLAYASRLFSGAEKSYSMSKKERLAVRKVKVTTHFSLSSVLNHPNPS